VNTHTSPYFLPFVRVAPFPLLHFDVVVVDYDDDTSEQAEEGERTNERAPRIFQ